MVVGQFWCPLLLALLVCTQAALDLNYCDTAIKKRCHDQHEFHVWMNEFTFALARAEMSIPCCAPPGYTVQWKYEGVPLEQSNSTFRVWSGDSSSQLPGRYIVSRGVQDVDKYSSNGGGRFECEARNPNTQASLSFKTTLNTYGMKMKYTPTIAFSPRDIAVLPGEHADFRCAFFVGFVPSILNDLQIVWTTNASSSLHFDQHVEHRNDTAADAVLVESVLHIPVVTSDMLESVIRFTCHLRNVHPGSNAVSKMECTADLSKYVDPDAPFNNLLVAVVCSLSVCIVLAALLVSYHVELRLLIKDKFGKVEQSGDKRYDVFVLYCSEDSSQLVYSSLLPYLESTLGYTCFAFERDALGGEYLPATLPVKLRSSRRLLLVLSAAMPRCPLCQLLFRAALDEALTRRLGLICLKPNSIKAKDVDGAELTSILSVAHKVPLPLDDASPAQHKRFWSKVRLRLPPRRSIVATQRPHSNLVKQNKILV